MGRIFVEMDEKEYEEFKKFRNKEIEAYDLYELILKFSRKNEFLKFQKNNDILDPLSKPIFTADFGIISKPNDTYKGQIRCIIKEERMLK